MAVEFDGQRNSQSQTICQDATTVNQGSRFDPDPLGSNIDKDIVQYVLWGRDSLINAPCRVNPFTGTNKTYDDNRHDTVREIWVYNSGSTSVSSPAVDARDPLDVRIYTGRSSKNSGDRLDKGRLIRLHPTDGAELWSRNPDSTSNNDDDIDSSPALDSSGDIYIGNDSFLIQRYNANGTAVWTSPTSLDGNIEGKPFVSDIEGRVYVATDNGTLYSLRKDTGAVVWSYDIGPSIIGFDYTSSPVAVYDSASAPSDNLIYVGSQDGSLYVVRDDGATPSLVRQFSPPAEVRSTPAINPVNGDVYFGSDDNNVYAVTAAGIGRWAVLTGGDIVSSPAVTGDGRTVYVGSDNGRLYIIALNPDGTVNNSPQTYPPSGDDAIGAIQGSPTIASDGTIIFGSDDGHLYAINPDRTLKWKYPAVGSIGAVRSKPAIGPDGIVYFGAEDGKLYAIDPALNDPPNDPGTLSYPCATRPNRLV